MIANAIDRSVARERTIKVPPLVRDGWTEPMKIAFRELSPRAVFMIATPAPVSGATHCAVSGQPMTTWGGATGVRLVDYGVTSAVPWTNQFQTIFTKGPAEVKLYWRLWCFNRDDEYAIEAELTKVLAHMAVEPDQNGFRALRFDVAPVDACEHVRTVAHLVASGPVDRDFELRHRCAAIAEAADRKALSKWKRR